MSEFEQYTNEELAEAHIFPPDMTKEEIAEADKAFSAFLAERRKIRTEATKLYYRNFQFKVMNRWRKIQGGARKDVNKKKYEHAA